MPEKCYIVYQGHPEAIDTSEAVALGTLNADNDQDAIREAMQDWKEYEFSLYGYDGYEVPGKPLDLRNERLVRYHSHSTGRGAS